MTAGGVLEDFIDDFISRPEVACRALGGVEEKSAAVRRACCDCSDGDTTNRGCAENIAGRPGDGVCPRGGYRPGLAEGQGALVLRLLDCLPEGEPERVLQLGGGRCPFAIDV